MSDAAPKATDASEFMWLRDILPSFFLNTWVATYNYESDWRKDVKTSLLKCGEQLLNFFYQNPSLEEVVRVALEILPLIADNHDVGKSPTTDIYWAQPWRFVYQAGWFLFGLVLSSL